LKQKKFKKIILFKNKIQSCARCIFGKKGLGIDGVNLAFFRYFGLPTYAINET